ncbi:MAG TPA: glycosyltransferase [Bacteroidia bacterium]|nr:glycosyltransferase [Bacteroidia bacterium]
MASSDRHLHIISFDVPFPPNYGGVIDVFYKIKSLFEAGIKIHLHCFQYGRNESKELLKYCYVVNYYSRNISKAAMFRKQPYIVISRSSEELLKTLQKDKYPIIFEGLHTCSLLDDPNLNDRIKIVRTHNIEHDYYRSLAGVEKNIFKRLYFYNEASKLEQFEDILVSASAIAAISPNDKIYFSKKNSGAFYLPAFHPNNSIEISDSPGDYALYHGNLSVGENNQAALYLVNEVFGNSDMKLIIAGSKPSAELKSAVTKFANIELLADIPMEQIMDLVRSAQVNVLPTFQPTGIKLKLLAALFNGRHVVVNNEMVENTGLEALCHIAGDAEKMRSAVQLLLKEPFDANAFAMRNETLMRKFSNTASVKVLLKKIYPE